MVSLLEVVGNRTVWLPGGNLQIKDAATYPKVSTPIDAAMPHMLMHIGQPETLNHRDRLAPRCNRAALDR